MAKLVTLIEETAPLPKEAVGYPGTVTRYWTTEGKLVFQKIDGAEDTPGQSSIDYLREIESRKEEEAQLENQKTVMRHQAVLAQTIRSDLELCKLEEEREKTETEMRRLNNLRVRLSDRARGANKNRLFNRYNGEINNLSNKSHRLHCQERDLRRKIILEYCVKHAIDARLFNHMI
jgi:hypothetical protein